MKAVPAVSAPRVLGAIAFALAALAPLGGSPFADRHASVDVAALARTVEREEDHVTALELARWIKERRPGLRIIDVRGPEEFEMYHVPGAERVAIDALPRTPFRATETLVLYSEGGAHAAQAWVFLRALGYRNVYFLRGGLYEWLDQVMNPTLAADATPAAREEFARAAALSRYFGGIPRSEDSVRSDDSIRLTGAAADSAGRAIPLPKQSTRARALEVRRRGC